MKILRKVSLADPKISTGQLVVQLDLHSTTFSANSSITDDYCIVRELCFLFVFAENQLYLD